MRKLGLLLVVSSLTIGCGKLHDALYGTVDLPGKIDQTNTNMLKTNEMLDESNKNAGKIKGGIHSQTLLLALDDMLKPRNAKDWQLPVKMCAGGQAFAENVTSEELVKFMHAYLVDINEQQPDDAELISDVTGQLKYPASYIKDFNHNKRAELMGLKIISGFLPQSVIDSIIATEVRGQGRYERDVYAVLAMRAWFVGRILLGLDLLETGLYNLGTVEAALDQAELLNFLVQLDFKEKATVTVKGFVNAAGTFDLHQNETVQLDVEEIRGLIEATKEQAEKVLLADQGGENAQRVQKLWSRLKAL